MSKMSIPLQNQVVYGPIFSRRLGVSLGINLLPKDVKFCLSNCLYCQYGWTDFSMMKKAKWLSSEEIIREIENDFQSRCLEGLSIEHITFCGNGEPTLHPELKALVLEVKKLRDRYFPASQVSIFSDSTRVYFDNVREALELLDQRYMKLDAGDEKMYRRLNQPLIKVPWEKMIQGLARLPGVILQSLFIKGPVDNSQGEGYQKWLETVERIHPKEIYVYTIDRPPADPRIEPVPANRLQEIQQEVEDKLAIPASVY